MWVPWVYRRYTNTQTHVHDRKWHARAMRQGPAHYDPRHCTGHIVTSDAAARPRGDADRARNRRTRQHTHAAHPIMPRSAHTSIANSHRRHCPDDDLEPTTTSNGTKGTHAAQKRNSSGRLRPRSVQRRSRRCTPRRSRQRNSSSLRVFPCLLWSHIGTSQHAVQGGGAEHQQRGQEAAAGGSDGGVSRSGDRRDGTP